ncbi:MAG TPA: PEP-CTERM sorting domain-containing protein [Cyanobacteria bacterium UBA8803]|nr:PEP-CTERM sorting domain-containing protein [Cyanobacteria bacterium UBA9273]HBL61772.1 PEP-CTERM sorting domain-containing protein [Cyanobacteria bacterium UBA8803]
MENQKITSFLRNTSTVAALVAASTAATAFLAPSASAVSLVPQEETEIDVGLGCLDGTKCLTDLTPYLIQSIVSETDSTTTTKSRLFVDNLLTANIYGSVFLAAGDAGTNPAGYWFRPSENGNPVEETGQLEVGTYTFTFTDIIPELKIAYFDAEGLGADETKVLATNGTLISGINPVPSGPNGNIQYQTWANVKTITLKLGKDTLSGTGDGVDFQLEAAAVPEPGAGVGLGALALMGIWGLRKRNKNVG